jgi:hypothetical protein
MGIFLAVSWLFLWLIQEQEMKNERNLADKKHTHKRHSSKQSKDKPLIFLQILKDGDRAEKG